MRFCWCAYFTATSWATYGFNTGGPRRFKTVAQDVAAKYALEQKRIYMLLLKRVFYYVWIRTTATILHKPWSLPLDHLLAVGRLKQLIRLNLFSTLYN